MARRKSRLVKLSELTAEQLEEIRRVELAFRERIISLDRAEARLKIVRKPGWDPRKEVDYGASAREQTGECP